MSGSRVLTLLGNLDSSDTHLTSKATMAKNRGSVFKNLAPRDQYPLLFQKVGSPSPRCLIRLRGVIDVAGQLAQHPTHNYRSILLRLILYSQDEDIADMWYYKLFVNIGTFVGRVVYGLTVEGEDNIPKGGPAMIIGIHTTHNTDFVLGVAYACRSRGRVIRAMLHYAAGFLGPVTNRFGGAPGSQDLALELLKAGNLVGIIPGGLEETWFHLTANGADAYSPLWESKDGVPRCGFARLALQMGAGFKVLPVVFENGEVTATDPRD